MLRDNLEGWEVGGRFKKEGTYVYLWLIRASLVAQLVKNQPAVQETWVGKIP